MGLLIPSPRALSEREGAPQFMLNNLQDRARAQQSEAYPQTSKQQVIFFFHLHALHFLTRLEEPMI